MKFIDLEVKLPDQYTVIVKSVRGRYSGKLWAWNVFQRVEEKSLDCDSKYTSKANNSQS